MDIAFLKRLKQHYREQLFDNIIPFWLEHGRDREYGGYVTCLSRDGSVHDQNKLCMWNSGRTIWMFSHFYNEIEARTEWLEMARHGAEFALKHAFDPDGRIYYSLTHDGKPLQASYDIWPEMFHVSGFSEYARATKDDALAQRAWDLFRDVCWKQINEPGQGGTETMAETAPLRVFGFSLISLNVLDELRRYKQRPEIESMIDKCLDNIFKYHVDREHKVAFERVLWNGEPAPGYLGRWVDPGHMIETGIFIVHEAQHRGDDGLIQRGIELIDWGFEHGWDKEFGGLINDIDLKGHPIPDAIVFYAQTKMWWSHAEALYALLLAYTLTDDEKFAKNYQLVHDYCQENFYDKEYGEWFAILDQRGHRLNDAKGNFRKSIFHIGRNLFYCWRLLEKCVT